VIHPALTVGLLGQASRPSATQSKNHYPKKRAVASKKKRINHPKPHNNNNNPPTSPFFLTTFIEARVAFGIPNAALRSSGRMGEVGVGISGFLGGFFHVCLGCQQLSSLFLPSQAEHFLLGVGLFRSTKQ